MILLSQTENAPQTENLPTEAKSEEIQDEGENKGDDEKQPLPSNHDNTLSTNAEGEMKKQPVESEEVCLYTECLLGLSMITTQLYAYHQKLVAHEIKLI